MTSIHMKKTFTIILFLLSIYIGGYAQKKPFQPTLNYTGDLVGNFSGGDKRDLQWMGVLDAGFLFDTELARWWKGGKFNIELINIHGKGISATTLHDLQGISGIEAGNHTLLIWELWYHHQLGKLGIRAGFQNINSDFMLQPFTDAFSCGSYQTFPTLALNYSLPNYPTAGLGISLSYQINKSWSLLTSVFNGKVADINRHNRYDLNWRLKPGKDGILSVTEVKHLSDSLPNPAHVCGFGFVFHNKEFTSVRDSSKSYDNNYTFYAFGERNLYRSSTRNAGLFLQGSYSLKNRNMAYGYSAIGITANGFLSRSHQDVAGIGLSQLYYQETPGNSVKNKIESTLEVFIKYQINKYLSLKPTFFTIVSTSRTTITAAMVEFGLTIL